MISLVTVVKNEESRIRSLLNYHSPWVDECVVVHDGPCTDRTLEIAVELGCRTYEAPYLGYCEPHRKLGLEMALGDWVLFVDADERMSLDFLQRCRIIARRAVFDGVMMPRRTVWTDDRTRPSVLDHQMRFMRKTCAYISSTIHTSPSCTGVVVQAPYLIHHENLASDIPEKIERYKQIVLGQLPESSDSVRAHLERCLEEMALDE